MPDSLPGTANVTMAQNAELRIQSPRPETPEPESRQGRRNPQPGAQLLDDDGGISEKVRVHFPSYLALESLKTRIHNLSSNIASSTYSRNIAHHPRQ